jgi:fucose 4-O-acetylase-like acetyltransferase
MSNGGGKLRDERMDSVKYWLIILVIVGHVLGKEGFSKVPECEMVRQWIYLFHMPLFVFISGYYSHKIELKKVLWKNLWKLMEPLILIQILMICVNYHKNGTISIKEILTPWWVLWYLLSLIYWRILIQFIPDTFLNNQKNLKYLVISTFIIGIIAGFLPFDRFLSFQRTFAFLPFFFLGYYMKGKNLFRLERFKLFYIVFLMLTFAVPLFMTQYLGKLQHADPYGNFYDACVRIFVFILSIPMSLAFINICPKIKWSAKQGKFSLQYYIYHALLISLSFIIIRKTNLPMSLSVSAFYSFVLIALLGMASYLPYFNKLTNPSSFLKR